MRRLLAVGLNPDNDEARRWLQDELSEERYQPDSPGLLQRIADAFDEWLADLFGGVGRSATPVNGVVAALAAIVLVILVIVLLRYVRRTPRVTGGSAVLDAAERRDARDHRRLAAEAMAAGNYDTAVVEAMRAIARAGIDRTLLPDVPSLTATEVASGLGRVFPAQAAPLHFAAEWFGAVVYGDDHATAAQAEAVLSLEKQLAGTRPRRTDAELPAEVPR